MTEAEDDSAKGLGVVAGAAGGGEVADATTRRAMRHKPSGSQRFHPLVELTVARVRGMVREVEVIFWIFVFPILLTFALGIAFSETRPERVRVAVESNSPRDPFASTIAQALMPSGEIDIKVLQPDEAARALRNGRVALVVRPRDDGPSARAEPGGANKDVAGGPVVTPSLDYRYDPARPECRQARLVVDEALQRAFGRADVVRAGDQIVSEPGARFIDFLIPGLLGMNLMGSGLWGVGYSVVIARSQKFLKQLTTTPMRRSHYLLSIVLSRLVFLVVEVVAVITFAWAVFGFRVQGSLFEMSLLLLVGAMTFVGIGLLVASRPRTTEGVSGLMNLVMMPMWLLSGTFFSSARFPDFLQPLIKVLPLTALNDGLRAVMNDGAPLGSHWVEVCILLAWGVVSFIVALRVFRWQ